MNYLTNYRLTRHAVSMLCQIRGLPGLTQIGLQEADQADKSVQVSLWPPNLQTLCSKLLFIILLQRYFIYTYKMLILYVSTREPLDIETQNKGSKICIRIDVIVCDFKFFWGRTGQPEGKKCSFSTSIQTRALRLMGISLYKTSQIISPLYFIKEIAIFSVIFGTHQRLNRVIVKFNQVLSQMVDMALIYSQLTLAKLVQSGFCSQFKSLCSLQLSKP